MASIALGPMTNSLAFYEAAAQLLPVIFIALVLELRYLNPENGRSSKEASWWSQIQRLISELAVLAVFISGEWVALKVLLDGHASHDQRSYVQTSVAVAGLFLVVPILLARARRIGNVAESIVELAVSVGVTGVALFFVIKTYV